MRVMQHSTERGWAHVEASFTMLSFVAAASLQFELLKAGSVVKLSKKNFFFKKSILLSFTT